MTRKLVAQIAAPRHPMRIKAFCTPMLEIMGDIA
jgi:hypothetical protein